MYENPSFHISNVTHGGRNNYQITLTFMKNQGNTLINTEKMRVDEHALVLIKRQIAPFNSPYQSCMKPLLFIVLMSLMLAQKIIE